MVRHSFALALALACAPLTAAAQTQPLPPPPPPPGATAQPQGYPPPPPPDALPPPPPPGAQPYAPVPTAQPVYVMPPGYGYARSRPVLVPYEEGAPVPPGARVITRPRLGLAIGGGVTFGVTWLLTALIGSLAADIDTYGSGRTSPALWLVAPVVGPFGFMAATNDSLGSTGVFWLALDGVAQGAGLAMLIYGLANPAHYLAYDQVARARPRWFVTPVAAGGHGASLTVTF